MSEDKIKVIELHKDEFEDHMDNYIIQGVSLREYLNYITSLFIQNWKKPVKK